MSSLLPFPAGLRAPLPLERVPAPSLEEFREVWLRRARPAVFTGALPGFDPAVWEPARLLERYGDARVTAYLMKGQHVLFDARQGLLSADVSLREFARGERPMRLRCALGDALPELRAHTPAPAYCARAHGLRETLWWSPPGTLTRLHFDLPHNLLAQLHGAKRFLLFAPSDTLRLSPCAPWSSTPQFSDLDLAAPALSGSSLARGATPYSATLEPGELLFLPSRWWHFAQGDGETLSLAYWWTPAGLAPLLDAVDRLKRLRGLTR